MEPLYTQIQSRLNRGEISRLERSWFMQCLGQVIGSPLFESTWQPLLSSYQHSWRSPLFVSPSLQRLAQWAPLFPELYFELRLYHQGDYHELFTSPLLAQVSHLRFFGCGFGGDDVDALTQSPHLKPLCGLEIEHEDLWEDDLAQLLQAESIQSLRRLSLVHNALGPESLLMITRSLEHLVWLNLEDNFIDDHSIQALVESPMYSSLEHLNIMNNQITNESAYLLATTPKTTPLTVRAGFNDIDEDGWRIMASSQWLSNDTQKRCKSILAELALDI